MPGLSEEWSSMRSPRTRARTTSVLTALATTTAVAATATAALSGAGAPESTDVAVAASSPSVSASASPSPSRTASHRPSPIAQPPVRKPRAARAAVRRPLSARPAPAPRRDGLNWAALAECESGGNPRAVSANGRYRGLYQFDLSTWRSVGGSGDPIDASSAEQTRRAQRLYAQRGRSPWPVCGRHL